MKSRSEERSFNRRVLSIACVVVGGALAVVAIAIDPLSRNDSSLWMPVVAFAVGGMLGAIVAVPIVLGLAPLKNALFHFTIAAIASTAVVIVLFLMSTPFHAMAGGMATALGATVVSVLIGSREPKAGVCPRCGYFLAGLTTAGCPECGWGRSEMRSRF